MKKLFTSVIAITILGCFLGKAQQTVIDNVVFGTPNTSPLNISGLQVEQRLITQNFKTVPLGNLAETGSFDQTARWNSMGSLTVGPTILNGFRAQSSGRGLAWGHKLASTTAGNPFVECIGNGSISSGDLEFRFAQNSIGGVSTNIFTMAPNLTSVPFNYAVDNAFIGHLNVSSGSIFGSFLDKDIWSATGEVSTPGGTIYGSRHQYKGGTFSNSILKTTGGTVAAIDFGVNSSSSTSALDNLVVRTFNDPADPATISNIMSFNRKFKNVLISRRDFTAVSPGVNTFNFAVIDGPGANASNTATTFVTRASIYATSDGLDDNSNRLPSYAAIVGDCGLTVTNQVVLK